jgi:hypothetical protein
MGELQMIKYKGKEIKQEGKLLKEYQEEMYQLKCGETLYSVCNKYGLDVQRILTLNPRINPTRSYEGILIKLK